MKKILFILTVTLFLTQTISAQNEQRMQWWREARLGMFIHWGVYAQLAGVYDGHEVNKLGEWIMNWGKIPVAEYQLTAKQFNPIRYNADEWVRMAKEAGMKYIIITAKHHDGFALFHTTASKWNIVDATPYGKDLLLPLAAACKKYHMKLGFYYSQAQDWCNPGGTAIRRITSLGWANPDSAKIDAYTQEHAGHWDPAQETSTFAQYIDQVAVPQVRELLSNYGDIAVLWWDTPSGMTDDAATKLQALLKLQPHIITNDRLKRPNFPGDTKTPEQRIPKPGEMDGADWETCMTMNDTWGYKSTDNKWKSNETLIRNLIEIASRGGNYLLNVGPKPDGTFPEQSIQSLKAIGNWMKVNGTAIYNTKASTLPQPSWGRITQKGNTLYLFVFDWPQDGKLLIPGDNITLKTARLLANGHKLTTNSMTINLPEKAPDTIAAVIEVQIKR
jgi:alpha-L-fucosidase